MATTLEEIERWELYYSQVAAKQDFARQMYKRCDEEDPQLERSKAVENAG